MADRVTILNKKARHNYELTDRFTAGIELYGTEIKSIRAGKASLSDSYCYLLPMPRKPDRIEVWALMHISEYVNGSFNNHEPKRERKLLLNKREIAKISRKVKSTGLTIIPTKLFINEKGFAKLEIAIARGKKQFDKRDDLRKSDDRREMDRMKKLNV